MEKKIVPAYVPGLLLALVNIVIFLVYYFSGRAFAKDFFAYLPMLVFLAFIIGYVVKFAKDNHANVTFGKCFAYGFKIAAFAALIYFVFCLVFILLFPELKEQYMQFMRTEMANNPQNFSDEQLEQGLQMVSKFFMVSFLGGTLFGNLVMGVIAALIGAAVAKKNPQSPFSPQT